jgi:hypothetical protein
MNRKRARFAPALSVVDGALERRLVLSGGILHPQAAAVAAHAVRMAATRTTLDVSAGTLGQPITFSVTVRAPAAAVAPQGTVNIVDHGQVIQTLTLSPTVAAAATGTSARTALSSATAALTPQPGGSGYFFGRHVVSAVFVPGGAFAKSSAGKTFTVSPPAYTTLSGGVQVATIAHGTGPAIQSGQTANVLYTGYLASNGQIFDDSSSHGGAPFGFTLGAGQVIPGFDAGVAGMQAGETRIVVIPPARGYGATATGSIPANSTLIFVLTLKSIS